MDEKAKEELNRVAKEELDSETTVHTIVKLGKPYLEILEVAKAEDVDLIIISTHGHTGVEQILFGSTADKVVRKAPCPVLTLENQSKVLILKAGINKLNRSCQLFLLTTKSTRYSSDSLYSLEGNIFSSSLA